MTTRLASWRTSGGFVMPAGLRTEEARPGISSESLQNRKCLRFVRTADSHFANHLSLTSSQNMLKLTTPAGERCTSTMSTLGHEMQLRLKCSTASHSGLAYTG